jgi:CubicO group peptidase (beta-lactamase class C family)
MAVGTGSGSSGNSVEIDTRVKAVLGSFEVPGLALAVVQDGQIAHVGAYGSRRLGEAAAVDGDTLFGVGSTTKSFTAAAAGILVDDGVLRWDDKVIDHLPDFALANEWITRTLTLRDVLAHRSGLSTQQGDLKFLPASDLSRTDILRALRHLPLSGDFRDRLDYNNTNYLIAAEVMAAASGQTWEENSRTATSTPRPMLAANSGMSPPAEKARSPAPVRITARMPVSASH